MAQALYRRYRPKDFSEVINQTPIKETLQNEITHDRVGHAYLFSGPRGVGKTTMARLLAKEVNTQSLPEKERVRVAQDIVSGKSIDVIEIDAASHTGVDNVRENIIENARFTPQQLRYKVFIIDEVHMLSTSAFNALLKTLEEPPEHVIFILATTEIHRIPDTIISRCQRFDFKRVNVSELVERMRTLSAAEGVTIDDVVLSSIARRADGSVRDAEVILGQVLALGEKKITPEQAALVLPRSNIHEVVALFLRVADGDNKSAIEIIHQLVTDGVQLEDMADELIEFLRTLLLHRTQRVSTDLDAYGFDESVRKQIDTAVSAMSTSQLIHMIETFVEATKELRFSTIPQLPFEIAIVSLNPDTDSRPQKPSSPPPSPATSADDSPQVAQSDTPAQKKEKPATKKEKKKTQKKSRTASASFEKIQKSWIDIIDAVGQKHRSTGMSLKVGLPYELSEGRLVIAFQHAFHAERIGVVEVRKQVEDIIANIIGSSVTIGTVVLDPSDFGNISQPPPKEEPAPDPVMQAAEIFSGEVVEEE